MPIINKLYKAKFTPYQILVLAFFSLILMGTFLLMLPISLKEGYSLSFIDALFTATSAVCVTGLVVVDTGHYFSTFGQMVIILLIQIGGLGIMTITTLFAIFMGRRLQLKYRIIVTESLNQEKFGGIIRIILKIFSITLLIEFIGGLCLGLVFFPEYGVKGFYYGFWHAISAFCNAGFDILGGSHIFTYGENPLFIIIISSLIILGGIGFMVMMEIYGIRKFQQFSLHTKIVLVATVVLLLLGTTIFFILEYNNPQTLGKLDFIHKVLGAFFLSTTARTAGFSLVDISYMSEASIFFMIILMFVGASPGSTGGGVKTTTMAVIFSAIYSLLKGKSEARLFNRRLDYDTIVKSLAIFYLMSSIIVFVTMYLCITENIDLMKILFEVVSALATVGLTTGITSTLSFYGKIIIILMMFIGRVGIFTFLMAIYMRSRQKENISYPIEKISVG